jgi:hypothetical protein
LTEITIGKEQASDTDESKKMSDFSFTFCTDFSLLIFISLDFLFKRQDTVGQAMQLIILE